MIKVRVIEDFTLKDFNKLENIVRNKNAIEGRLFKGDIFECSEEMARYLTGENIIGKTVVEVIEVKPEKKEDAEEVSEEVVQAVANAIVEEAEEQNKEVETIVNEIVEESKEEKSKKNKKKKNK